MTPLMVLNLGFAWGAIAPPTFNPAWAVNATQVAAITPQSVQK